jgi:hypothetical protein
MDRHSRVAVHRTAVRERRRPRPAALPPGRLGGSLPIRRCRVLRQPRGRVATGMAAGLAGRSFLVVAALG